MTVKENCNIRQGYIHSDCSSLLPFIFCKLPDALCQSERGQERPKLIKKDESDRKKSGLALSDKAYSIQFHMNNQSQLFNDPYGLVTTTKVKKYERDTITTAKYVETNMPFDSTTDWFHLY